MWSVKAMYRRGYVLARTFSGMFAELSRRMFS
jgi:hypothetical protein